MKSLSWLFHRGPEYSFKKVCTILLISSFSLLLLYLLCYLPFYLLYQREERIEESYHLTKMVVKHRGLQKMGVPLFAEMLELCRDRPRAYSNFDVKKEEKRLQALGIFSHLIVKKRKPDLVLVEYELKEPAFILGGFSNTLLSVEGDPMPYAPYYSAKNLPILYIDLEKIGGYFGFLQELVGWIKRGELLFVDMRHIEAESKARKEIVMKVQQGKGEHILRLDPVDVAGQLRRYYVLLDHLSKERSMVIDLRFPNSGYLENL